MKKQQRGAEKAIEANARRMRREMRESAKRTKAIAKANQVRATRWRKEMTAARKAAPGRIREMKRLGMSLTRSPGLMTYQAQRRKQGADVRARRMLRPSVQAARAARERRRRLRQDFQVGGRLRGLRPYYNARKAGNQQVLGQYIDKASLIEFADKVREAAQRGTKRRKQKRNEHAKFMRQAYESP
jgi:hypothetical protein